MGFRERWQNSNMLTKTTLALVPALGAFFGAIAGAPAAIEAWDNLGLPTPAMRAYVRERVHPVQTAQTRTDLKFNDLQLDVAIGKRENYDNEKAKWQLEISKAQDDGTRALAIQQIQKIDRNNDALSEQIRALRGNRGPN